MTHEEKLAHIAQLHTEIERIRAAEELAETDIERRALLGSGLVFLTPQAE
jgi:hypothetical protein